MHRIPSEIRPERRLGRRVRCSAGFPCFTRLKKFGAIREMPVKDDWKARYSRSVNSVLYFIQLPFGLNDQAVNKRYLGQSIIRGEPYDMVEVTFQQESGGEDFQDVFIYWFHHENNTMDYFAYSYEVNEGGLRFRAAINPRVVEGILFQDYENYEAKTGTDLTKLPKYFESGTLKLLSKIENKNVKVSLLK